MDICRPNLIWINGSCYRKNQASDSTEFDHENTPTGGDAIGKKHPLITVDDRTEFTEYRSFGSVLFGSVR